MLHLIISSLYFIVPAYIANMCPVIFSKKFPVVGHLPFNIPVYEKLFGSHKTWRGVYTAYIGALLGLFIQYLLSKNGLLTGYELINYQSINLFLYAFLFGVGAIVGDMIKSFFKRRIGIKPGRPWIPFDQIDFIIGAVIFLLPVYILPWQNILALLILTPLLHFLANLLGYFLGLKKVWW